MVLIKYLWDLNSALRKPELQLTGRLEYSLIATLRHLPTDLVKRNPQSSHDEGDRGFGTI